MQRAAGLIVKESGRGAVAEVALATSNSEPYLGALLDSLFAQTCQDFSLLISDDGSTDGTSAILASYQRLHPGRIRIIHCGERNGGSPLANFSHLIDHLTADYALFCDHDDIWLADKIAISLREIQALEAEHGAATPLLVHTDLMVVGPDLQVWDSSSLHYQGIDPARNSLIQLLMANTVSGCAAGVNRALYERARPVPPEAMMHDHWLALVAAAVGRIRYVDKSTILYRQHGRNAIGAVRWAAPSILTRVRQTLIDNGKRRTLERMSRQAEALLAHCGRDMSPEDFRATQALATLWAVSPWRRFGLLRRHGLMMNGLVRNIASFVTVTRPGARS